MHQHIDSLDANPDHARQEANHGVWSILKRLLETLQAIILDLPYLIIDKPPAYHVAMQLSERVGRDRLAFGRAQTFKALGGLLQLGICARAASAHTAVEPEPTPVPVQQCARCGDCDYGDSEAADRIRAECALRRGESSEC